MRVEILNVINLIERINRETTTSASLIISGDWSVVVSGTHDTRAYDSNDLPKTSEFDKIETIHNDLQNILDDVKKL